MVARYAVVFFVVMGFIVVPGMTIGFTDMHVKQIEFASKDLPKAFDGYRIVQFSDAHIATYDNIKEDDSLYWRFAEPPS